MPPFGFKFHRKARILSPIPYIQVMKRTSKSEPRWRVTSIQGAHAQEICQLRAKSAGEAIKRAIREFDIDPERQKRLAVYQVA